MTDNSSYIPFNRPSATGREFEYIREAIANAHLSGNGPFTKRCSGWLERTTGAHTTLLTHSCTAALEMAALLLELGPGDEVMMPSFTFVSTANAFVLRGAARSSSTPARHAEPRRAQIEAAITPRTRASCPCTTPASPARWTRSWRSPREHDLRRDRGRRPGTHVHVPRAAARRHRPPRRR